MADKRRFAVLFDEVTFREDLRHATARGRAVAVAERARLERDGASPGELRRCAAEGPEGTRLAGCVKTYLPQPDGAWGMVLRGWDREGAGLVCVAFGRRHPRHPWQPSVYQVADRRLHGG